ncbi:kinase-like domain-containing protein [Dactylonectria estremocensis]|uniref:Kinase-like domain-containing protein n=1 Tax=Dactylonectria estremocensis TaxID=1079267 RepID=A0A9P9JCQ6_9HYPO|nr:kinase-like domain-containing protein [Dactylonectria estremocensis]
MSTQTPRKLSNPTLYKELNLATRTCPITDRKYISSRKIDEAITVENVKGSLNSKKGWLRWPCRDRRLDKLVDRARKVLAILALLAKLDEGSVKNLSTNGLTDKYLPLYKIGDRLKSHRLGKEFSFPAWSADGLEQFQDNQWTVLAHELTFIAGCIDNIDLPENCAFQFSKCKEVGSTDFSTVYRADIPSSENLLESDIGCIAVKKFNKGREQDYDKEKKNLEKIKSIDNPHLIKHLAVCDQFKCIIFPWAEGGDLGQLWERESPNERTIDLFSWSLKQLVGLAHALQQLHSIGFRHGDIKPSNIFLFIENGTGTLKIADMGVSKEHKQDTDLRVGVTITTASTRAYEAPEANHHKKSRTPRSRKYDCWSMGCIILEFVVWLLYDSRALESFKTTRNSELHEYYRLKSSAQGDDIEWQDAMERHPKVDEAIQYLRDDARCKNTALEDLVNLVDSKLLRIDKEERLTAAELHRELQAILRQCNEEETRLVNKVPSPDIPSIFNQPPSKSPGTKTRTVGSTY